MYIHILYRNIAHKFVFLLLDVAAAGWRGSPPVIRLNPSEITRPPCWRLRGGNPGINGAVNSC
jgi:hypothetical protein